MTCTVDATILQLKKAFETQRNVKMLELRESLLPNWGQWQRAESGSFIDRATGAIKISLSAKIMDFAPEADVSGWYTNEPVKYDVERALWVHYLIQQLADQHRVSIYNKYLHCIEGLDSTARSHLRRAMMALADLMPDYKNR